MPLLALAALTCCAALLLGCATARPVRSRLRVRQAELDAKAREGCLQESRLNDAIVARLGLDPWRDHRLIDHSVEVSTVSVGRLVRAHVRLIDHSGKQSGKQSGRQSGKTLGRRTITTSVNECAELHGALALAISMALQARIEQFEQTERRPRVGQAAARRHGSTRPSRPPTTRSTRVGRANRVGLAQQQVVARHVPADAGPALTLCAAGLLSVGTAPAPAGGLQLRLAARWRHLSLGLEGRFDAPASKALAVGRVRTSLIGGAVSGCGHDGSLFGCGVVVAGALFGSGQDLVGAREALLPYVSAGPRAGLEIELTGRLAVRVHADLLFAFNELALRDSSSGKALWQAPRIAGSFGFGLFGAFL